MQINLNLPQRQGMTRKNLTTKLLCWAIIFILGSCNSKNEEILINKKKELWHVVQKGKTRNIASQSYFRFNKDHTYKEIYFFYNKFKNIDSNPDIINHHKWKIFNDSILEIAFIKYRIIVLNDSLGSFVNIKRPFDTILLKKFFIK